MLSTLVGLLVVGMSGQQADYQTAYKAAANKGLFASLARMYKIDQELRSRITEDMKANRPLDRELLSRLDWVDRQNTGHMRQIVRTYGWPTSKFVGKSGANMAWLLVQHADHNPGFQRECLDLMTPLLGSGEVDKRNYAYLTDRVLIAEGKKQVYGSQFEMDPKGGWRPKPLEDPDNVDKRRKEMGMESLAEYKKLLEQVYGKGGDRLEVKG